MKQKLLDDGDESAKLIKFDGDGELEGTKTDNRTKFWFPIKRYDSDKDKWLDTGEIQCSLQLYPKELADKNPQGVGREEPNNDPFCPPPEGRIQLSLNPFKMLAQLIPPKLRRQLCCALCCIICLGLCVMMGPMIFSSLIASAMGSIF